MEYWLDKWIKKKIFLNIRKETAKYVSNSINLISEIIPEILMVKKAFIPKVNSIRLYYAENTDSLANYFRIIKTIIDENNKIHKLCLLAPEIIPTENFAKCLKKWIPQIPLQVKFHEEKGNVLIVFLE